jgi:hypothetical protein
MHPELLLIKFLCTYDNYKTWRAKIDILDFSKEYRVIIQALDNLTTDPRDVDINTLGIETFKLAKKDKEILAEAMEQLLTAVPPSNVVELLEAFARNATLRQLSTYSYEASVGTRDFSEVQELVSKLDQPSKLFREPVTDNLEELLDQNYRQKGLRWRLNCLNKSLGSLRPGDFGFIFARPETGKTTFLASEVSFMAQQTEGDILWLNNEEKGGKVKLRVYQAALGRTKQAISDNYKLAWEVFIKRTGGRIKIFDEVHSRKEAEDILASYKPSLVVIDQLDKIIGPKADREDLALGSTYQWGRDSAKRYGCPVIGVSQADGTAEGVRWLHMGHVSNAKTSKQAEADFILGIGKTDEPGFEYNRFLSICKNKLDGDPDSDEELRHGRFEVLIEPQIARYKDIGE